MTPEPVGREFYLPHKPVIRESAESTKLRIVFDASARSNEKSPSLNDCLETGPPLQNLLWDVLVRNRLKPIALAGDLRQAFLQVHIRTEDRDALTFQNVLDQGQSNIRSVTVHPCIVWSRAVTIHVRRDATATLREPEEKIPEGSRRNPEEPLCC